MTEKISRQVQGNAEKTITMADSCVDRCWEMWHLSMGSLTAVNEQMEQITASCLDQRKKAIAEGAKVTEQIITQFQNDQKSMLNMVREAIKYTLENIDDTNHPIVNYWADLNKKYPLYPSTDVDVA